MINFKILTLFPEMFPGPLGLSLAGKAMADNKWSLEVCNIRDFAKDKHKTVDDVPYGGGTGMVMKPDILGNAVENTLDKCNKNTKLIYFSPRGKLLSQEKIKEIIKFDNVVLLCGRYEGVDQRVIDEYNFEEISVGDFILSGGEIPALTLMDGCIRLLDGVIGHDKQALAEESFSIMHENEQENNDYAGLLEYPLYTRPSIWKNREVPDVLSSGHHENIKKWRYNQALDITKERRPDLLKNKEDKTD